MKKLVTLCLITVLILSSLCIGWGYSDPISVPGTISLGSDYVNENFSKVFNIYNDGAGYRNVTIEADSNNLGLKVSPSKVKIAGNQAATITISGHFPKVNGSFSATLTIKDDLKNTSDKVVFVTGYAKPKNSGNSKKLSTPTNGKIVFDESKQAYILSWDPVKNASSYNVVILCRRLNKKMEKNVTDCKIEIKYNRNEFGWYIKGYDTNIWIQAKSPKYGSSNKLKINHSSDRRSGGGSSSGGRRGGSTKPIGGGTNPGTGTRRP